MINEKYFYKLDKKHKVLFILSKFLVILAVIAMGVLAIFMADIKLPTIVSKVNLSLGIILVLIVVVLGIFNRLKQLLKIKGLSFLIVFLLLLCFQYTIEALLWTTGLVSIPLLIDDILISPIWKNYIYNNVDVDKE